MPSTFRRNIPNVNINVFVYAKNPDDRFVIINMKKYRTGQKIADELEVAEIKSDSLVLRHNNITFQIKRP
jgi:general secretion pathway protein B